MDAFISVKMYPKQTYEVVKPIILHIIEGIEEDIKCVSQLNLALYYRVELKTLQ